MVYYLSAPYKLLKFDDKLHHTQTCVLTLKTQLRSDQDVLFNAFYLTEYVLRNPKKLVKNHTYFGLRNRTNISFKRR